METTYRAYPQRWIQLCLFASLAMTNTILWISFAPIATLTASFFGVSITAVNLLSLMSLILYLPGTLMASALTDRFGMRTKLVVGALLVLLAGLFRFLSVFLSNGYGLLLFGQCCGAMAAPGFLNAPVALSGNWFPLKERDSVMVIASMASPVGSIIGELLSSMIVDENGGMQTLLLIELIAVSIVCPLSFFLIKEHPKTPPAPSRHQEQKRNASENEDKSLFMRSISVFWTDSRKMLFENNEFLKLFIAFGIGLGIFNALLTLMQQLVTPAGYNDDDAGIFGAVLFSFGLFGAAIVGFLMDKTHKYKPMLRVLAVCIILSLAIWVLTIRPDNFGVLVFTSALVGFFMIPMLPVCLENGAECTYPISEEGSSSLLMMAGQYFGIPFTLAMEKLNRENQVYTGVFTSPFIFLMGFTTFAMIFMIWYNGPYLRLERELGGNTNGNTKNSTKESAADSSKSSESLKEFEV